MTESIARRLFQLVEPIAVVTYMADEPTEAVMALGLPNVWDAYFAGRAAPLGRDVPAAVVHALFYNFADGEVARHIPRVWDMVAPEAVNAARERGSVATLRRILGDLADTPGVARAADLLTKAGTNAPMEGRALFAALRTLSLPTKPVARLWHGANLLREHRGDGHVAALLTEGIGGTEAHVLHALSEGMPAEKFGRVSHLPEAQLSAVVGGMRDPRPHRRRRLAHRRRPPDQGTDRIAHRRTRCAGLRHSRAGRARPARQRPRAPRRSPRRCRFALEAEVPHRFRKPVASTSFKSCRSLKRRVPLPREAGQTSIRASSTTPASSRDCVSFKLPHSQIAAPLLRSLISGMVASGGRARTVAAGESPQGVSSASTRRTW